MIPEAYLVFGSGISCVALLVVYVLIRNGYGAVGTFLPDAYLAGLLLFCVGGVFVAWHEPSPEASTVALLGNLTLLSGLVGSVTTVAVLVPAYRNTSFADQVIAAPLRRFDRLVGLLASVGVVTVTGAFIYLVLTGPIAAVFHSLAAFVSDAALLDVRKAVASSRDGYLAPGYVKQFRDILGPILVVSLGWSPSRRIRLLRIPAFLLLVTAILLSGQRAPLVILLLSLLAGWYLLRKKRQVARPGRMRTVGMLSVAFLVLLVAMDRLLGRVSTEVPLWAVPVTSLRGLLDRAVVTVPRSNVATFDLWVAQAPSHGQAWLQELSAILPGPAEEMFTNVLHVAGGGSPEGNLVLGMASDLWLAWGWPGVLIVPALFALCIGVLDLALYRGGSRITLATRIYVFFALPIMYSPYGFALYGGSVALVLLLAVTFWRGLARLSDLRPATTLDALRWSGDRG